ncbi:MAG TPA: hypothetical protein VEF90_05560 [Xanthobacteraceae bacterium]|nr:hypothetical protein [Xanthobacteraceae bacterium]
MPLNHGDADFRASGQDAPVPAAEEKRLVGTVIKFPDEGRIVRFGRDAADESATIIILPVIRIERYADPRAEEAEPHRHPPADNGGRRRLRRR